MTMTITLSEKEVMCAIQHYLLSKGYQTVTIPLLYFDKSDLAFDADSFRASVDVLSTEKEN